ncbi:hypothetical protein V6C53_18745 [Desulfocurvibacter africanus]|uniref:hypothetical protein n=1 Tax=Desulfocurvibacter africanus TaxID=873 RepID=UPI002FD9D52B
MSIYKHQTDTPGGVPVLVVLPGYKPCRKTKRGEERRFRSREMADGRVCCPGCDNMCLLPAEVLPGGEFVVFRPKGKKEDTEDQIKNGKGGK